MDRIKLFDFSENTLECNKNLTEEEWFKRLNVSKLHEEGYKGEGLKIAIIDTGCQTTHPVFNNKFISGSNFTTENFNEIPFWDGNGHGTFCASIINTICPFVEIIVCKVLDSRGSGSYDSIIAGLNFAIEQNVDVISMSLGGSKHDDRLYESILKAVNKDILVVCASGNESHNDIDVMEYSYPAFYNEVIEVSACDYNYNVAPFSNNNKNIDVISYGVNINGALLDNKFGTLSGTSMATPMVAGFLILLKQKFEKEFNRKLTEQEIYASLIQNTEPIQNVPRWGQGFGYIVYHN